MSCWQLVEYYADICISEQILLTSHVYGCDGYGSPDNYYWKLLDNFYNTWNSANWLVFAPAHSEIQRVGKQNNQPFSRTWSCSTGNHEYVV